MDDQSQGFLRKLGHFFPISEKGQGRPPSPPPSSYAPVKYGSDDYKTLPNLFVRFHIRVIYHRLPLNRKLLQGNSFCRTHTPLLVLAKLVWWFAVFVRLLVVLLVLVFSTRSTCFSTRSTRFSTRSTRLSTRSSRLSTRSTRLSNRSTRSTICRSFYNRSYFNFKR